MSIYQVLSTPHSPTNVVCHQFKNKSLFYVVEIFQITFKDLQPWFTPLNFPANCALTKYSFIILYIEQTEEYSTCFSGIIGDLSSDTVHQQIGSKLLASYSSWLGKINWQNQFDSIWARLPLGQQGSPLWLVVQSSYIFSSKKYESQSSYESDQITKNDIHFFIFLSILFRHRR